MELDITSNILTKSAYYVQVQRIYILN